MFFISYFLFYIFRLTPALSPRDGAELTVIARTLSIAHPPGYPLYSIIGRIFSLIPFGNVAYRVNLLSLFFGALTVEMVYRCAKNLTAANDGRQGINIPAVFAGFLAWLLPCLAAESTAAEVFTLHTFLFLVLFYTLSAEKPFLLLFFFILGVSLANHQSVLFALPGLFFLLYRRLKPAAAGNSGGKRLIVLPVIFFIGISAYLYMPLRSFNNPPVNWGLVSESAGNFLKHILRRDYGTFRLSVSSRPFAAAHFFPMFRFFIKRLFSNLGVLAVIFFVAGLFPLFRGKRKIFYTLVFLIIVPGPVFLWMSGMEPDERNFMLLERFLILPFLVIPLISVFSFRFLFKRFPAFFSAAVIAVLAPVFYFRIPVSNRNDFTALDIMRNVFSQAEKNSVLFISGDSSVFGSWYLEKIIKTRDDVIPVGTWFTKWYLSSMRKEYGSSLDFPAPGEPVISGLIKRNEEKRRFYVMGRVKLEMDYPVGYNPYPAGLVYRIARGPGHTVFINPFREYIIRKKSDIRNWGQSSGNGDGSHSPELTGFQSEILSQYGIASADLCYGYINMGRLEEAAGILTRIPRYGKEIDPGSFSLLHDALGVAYFGKAQFDLAKEYFERGIEINGKNPSLFSHLAAAAFKTGDYETVIRNAGLASAISGDTPETLNLLGSAYYALDRKKEARKYFLRALELDPQFTEARENLKLLD